MDGYSKQCFEAFEHFNVDVRYITRDNVRFDVCNKPLNYLQLHGYLPSDVNTMKKTRIVIEYDPDFQAILTLFVEDRN